MSLKYIQTTKTLEEVERDLDNATQVPVKNSSEHLYVADLGLIVWPEQGVDFGPTAYRVRENSQCCR